MSDPTLQDLKLFGAIVLWILVLLVFLWFAFAEADHLGWMQHKDAFGRSCCNDIDCLPADVQADPSGQVLVNGIPLRLPRGSIHPSQTPESGWYCYDGPSCLLAAGQPIISSRCARCVFYTLGPAQW